MCPTSIAWAQAAAKGNANAAAAAANNTAAANAAAAAAAAQQQQMLMLSSHVQRPVGGIAIKADGLLENAGVDASDKLSELATRWTRSRPIKPAPLRKISLRGLEAAIEQAIKAGRPLSEDVLLLAGCSISATSLPIPNRRTSCWSDRAKAGS